jgi:hypothetical protein
MEIDVTVDTKVELDLSVNSGKIEKCLKRTIENYESEIKNGTVDIKELIEAIRIDLEYDFEEMITLEQS